MTSDPVACPYCNSLITVVPGALGGQHIPCSRCGESFTLLQNGPAASTNIRSQRDAPTAPPLADGGYRKPIQANRRLVLIILGVMACLFLGALAFALATQDFRRQNDKGITQGRPKRRPPLDDAPSSANGPTAPARLAALAWLPEDTNLIIGVHVREIAGNDAAKSLLTQPLKPTLFNNASISIESLISGLGFKLGDIDHVVLGVKVDDFAIPTSMPRLTLLVRTRQDYDASALQQRLKAERTGMAGTHPYYEFRVSEGFKPCLCCLDNRTLAYALVPNHLRDIPAAPRADLPQLSRQLREVLTMRMGPVGPLWLAGQPDDWNEKAVQRLTTLLLGKVKEEDRKRLQKVRTFAAWVQLDESVQVQATFNCGDDRAAKDLQMFLKIADDGANPDWKAFHGDGWLTVQMRTHLDKVREALER